MGATLARGATGLDESNARTHARVDWATGKAVNTGFRQPDSGLSVFFANGGTESIVEVRFTPRISRGSLKTFFDIDTRKGERNQ